MSVAEEMVDCAATNDVAAGSVILDAVGVWVTAVNDHVDFPDSRVAPLEQFDDSRR